MRKLPYGSLAVSVIAVAIVNTGTPDMTAWPYTAQNVNEYPMPMTADDSVPFYAVILFGIGLWLVFGAMEIFLCNRHSSLRRRIRFAILLGMTMFESFLVTATLFGMAKYAVAEPRPDFKVRCLGSDSAIPTYDANGNVICTGSLAVIREGRNSFPSGHAASSMCFGIFGALYLLWFVYLRKIHLPWRNDKGCMTIMWYQISHALFCLCLFPVFVGLAIACTRVRDHRHSPADVTAGALLGSIVSALYFIVRVIHESPEHACADMDLCDCGQVYHRLPFFNAPSSSSLESTPEFPRVMTTSATSSRLSSTSELLPSMNPNGPTSTSCFSPINEESPILTCSVTACAK